jgi:predicted ATPase
MQNEVSWSVSHNAKDNNNFAYLPYRRAMGTVKKCEKSTQMKVSIKNIGPMKDISMELGDITIINGFPNSGKSYLLKSIYSSLSFLDQKILDSYTRENFKEILKSANYVSLDNLVKESNKNLSGEMRMWLAEVLLNLVKVVGQEEIKYDPRGVISNKYSELIKSKLNFPKFTGKFELVIKNADLQIKNYLKSLSENNLKQLVSVGDGGSVKFDGKTINDLIDDSVDVSFLTDLKSLTKTSEIAILDSFRFVRNTAAEFIALRILREFRLDQIVELSLSKIEKDKQFWTGTLVVEPNFSHLSTRFFDFLSSEKNKTPFERIVKAYSEIQTSLGDSFTLEKFEYQYISISNEVILRKFFELSIEEFISNLKFLSGLTGVKFLPYGRNAMVQFQSYANKFGSAGEEGVNDILADIKSAPYFSYFQWLIDGRAKLNNMESLKLKKLFSSIVGGQLAYSEGEGFIGYQYKQGKVIDISLSSAMVQEMSGILLPLLSAKEGELIIIEEPEAQLHVRSQLYMGLLLIAVVRLKKVKVIFSTHSDLLALIITYLQELRSNKNSILRLVSDLNLNNKVNDEGIDLLATLVGENLPEIILRNYFINENGNIEDISVKDMINNVPGISDTVDKFLSWIFIESSRSKENERGTEK